MLLGLTLVLAAFDDTSLDHERMLKLPDAVFESSTRNVLLLAGVFHLVVGTMLVLIRDFFTKGLLLLWSGSICGMYRAGFSWLSNRWMPVGASSPIVELTADKMGVHPRSLGLSWGLVLAGMALGVLLQWVWEWWRRKQRKDAEFMKHWRETRGDKGRFP